MTPRMDSVVRRRLLVNYRTDPAVTARLLPPPLRPQLVNGHAVAGICLIRLGQVRPWFLPAAVGLRSENAAHRIAVEWDTADGTARGVYIPRRHSGALLTVMLGGRVFPGVHHRARFRVRETPGDLRVAFTGTDDAVHVDVHARPVERWPADSVFSDLNEASEFFRQAPAGYSTTNDACCLDGLELETSVWRVRPVEVLTARSAFFDDPSRFPPGSATLDCGLLMRDVPAMWRRLPSMPIGIPAEPAAGVR